MSLDCLKNMFVLADDRAQKTSNQQELEFSAELVDEMEDDYDEVGPAYR